MGKKRRVVSPILKLIGATAVIAALSACSMISHSTRVKLTATVVVDGRTYTGAAVQEYGCTDGGGVLGSMNVAQCRVKGEAVVVDLKERGYLFVTLGYGDTKRIFDTMMRSRPVGWHRDWVLPSKAIPKMVMFQNRLDPATAVEVLPDRVSDAFGPGVTLKSVTIGYSMSGITRGKVENAIPWVMSLYTTLGGNHGQIPGLGVLNMDRSSFIRRQS